MQGILSGIVKLHKWCNCREWVLVLLLLVAVARLPTLVTPHFYGDEEIYFVMGRAWSTGVPMYEAMFDHKPPLIYVIAGIFSTIPLFRGFLLFSMLLHTVLFWKLAQKFWGERHIWLARLSSLIFVVLSTIPTFEGHIVNAELLMMLPVTASLLLIWPEKVKTQHKLPLYLVAGLIAGIGWLYKIPTVFDVAAIALFVFVFAERTLWNSIKALFSARFWLYIIGFGLPLLMTFVYYYLKGHGESYLATVFTVNLGYVSSWKSDDFTTFNPFRSGLVVRGAVLAAYTLLLYILRNRLDRRLLFGALWSGFALFGALLSYRPYPHYLQEVVPAISLLIPTLFTTQTVMGWIVWSVVIGAGVVVQRDVGFWAYDSKSFYTNYWELITKQISSDEYRNRFDNAKRNYEIANYIKERTTQGDQIYVWGSDPAIYNLTNKVPSGGKYIVSFHVRDLRKYDYVMANLMEQEPKAIVMLSDTESFDELDALLSARYVLVYENSGGDVYFRAN